MLLVLMRACPGAGKTTLAKQLAARLGGKIYSADSVLIADEEYIWTPELSWPAHFICQSLVKLAIVRREKTIIVDNTNLAVKQAKPYVVMAKEHGYTVDVHEPQTPWRHDIDGLMEHGTHGLSREKVEEMLGTWKNMPLEEFKAALEI